MAERTIFVAQEAGASANALKEITARLADALIANGLLWECLGRVSAIAGAFLGAGCVAQTVWNVAHGKPPAADILDYDLVYFDPDLSEEREDRIRVEAEALVADLGITLDVKNQARVHVWYADRFGYAIEPYESLEDAISTWPTTATSVGVRFDGERLTVVAPFGLDDLFDLVVRANRIQITPEIYAAKVSRWQPLWPRVTILPWKEGVGTPGERRATDPA